MVNIQSDAWDADDFGDTPRKVDGIQLTIFYDDSHEPPDPDDYSTLADYEWAFSKWQLINQSMENTMTFQFSQTEIANQIAQLQEQLNQLTATLQQYRECEEKAEKMRLGVAEWGAEMISRGINQIDLLKWAKSLYSAACDEEFVEGGASLIEAVAQRDEALAKIKENDNYRKLYDDVRAECDQLKKQLTKIESPTLIPIVENIEDIKKVEVPKKTRVDVRVKGREFINSVKTKSGMNNISWTDISKVCEGNKLILKEICLEATTKYQEELIEKIPGLLADYIAETGDITDMSWIGNILKSKVEELLEAKKSQPYHSNDSVRETESGKEWMVKSFDGEWLSVVNGNKIASLHKSEVELLNLEVAA